MSMINWWRWWNGDGALHRGPYLVDNAWSCAQWWTSAIASLPSRMKKANLSFCYHKFGLGALCPDMTTSHGILDLMLYSFPALNEGHGSLYLCVIDCCSIWSGHGLLCSSWAPDDAMRCGTTYKYNQNASLCKRYGKDKSIHCWTPGSERSHNVQLAREDKNTATCGG